VLFSRLLYTQVVVQHTHHFRVHIIFNIHIIFSRLHIHLMYQSFILYNLRDQQLKCFHSCYRDKRLIIVDPGLLPITFDYESHIVLSIMPSGVIFFLYTHLTLIGLCHLDNYVISQVSLFSIVFISSCISVFHFESRATSSYEIISASRHIRCTSSIISYRYQRFQNLEFLGSALILYEFFKLESSLKFLKLEAATS
jgi:hypothetical protein